MPFYFRNPERINFNDPLELACFIVVCIVGAPIILPIVLIAAGISVVQEWRHPTPKPRRMTKEEIHAELVRCGAEQHFPWN